MPLTRLAFLPLTFVIFAGGLALAYYTPRQLRFIYFILHIASIALVNYFVPLEEYKANDYAFNVVAVVWAYRALEFFVISDPFEDYFWVGDGQNKKADDAPAVAKYKDLSAWGRAQWIFSQLCTLRGIGWSWSIDQLPPGDPVGTSKVEHIWHLLQRFAFIYLLQDVARTYYAQNEYVQSDGTRGTPIGDLTGLDRVWNVILCGIITFIQSETVILIGEMIGTATGLFWFRPENNRPVYGQYKDAYTVRRFWGRVWHQMFRRSPQVVGRKLANDILSFPKGSLGSRYLQLYVSFAMSGFFHWFAAKLAFPELTFYKTMMGFIWMAHGIMFEDFVIWLGKQAGLSSPNWKYVGYIWTIAFMSWKSTYYFDDCIEGGYFRPETFPVSVIRGIWKGEWATQTV